MSVLSAKGVCKRYSTPQGWVDALLDVSLSVEEGEFVGVAGESGSGKSTFARVACALERPSSGSLEVCGIPYPVRRRRERKRLYGMVQMVFQNPGDSFDPRMTLGASLAETARNYGAARSDAEDAALAALERVGLSAAHAERLAKGVSGGECQRAAIARALLVRPRLLICDEVTSALDVSAQAQVLRLLQSLREEYGMAILFISHDLAVARAVSDRIAVMCEGQVVETGEAAQVIDNPSHPYTKKLIAAIPRIESAGEGAKAGATAGGEPAEAGAGGEPAEAGAGAGGDAL